MARSTLSVDWKYAPAKHNSTETCVTGQNTPVCSFARPGEAGPGRTDVRVRSSWRAVTTKWPTHHLLGSTSTVEKRLSRARTHTVLIRRTSTLQQRVTTARITVTTATTRPEPTMA